MKRTLSLRTEHLTELTPGELTAVAGASGAVCNLIAKYLETQVGCDLTGHYTGR